MSLHLPPLDEALSAAKPDITFDDRIVTIFGVPYAIELFRYLGLGPVGSCIQIVSREDGVVTLKRIECP